MTKQLTKTASFTDIHFGAKNNSDQHNEDCLRFVEWFCEQVRNDPTVDNIMYLGDWFENRTAVNISTMNYSYKAAKLINELGLPVYFIVGNHDLYRRHSREIFSTASFEEFSNFTIVDNISVFPNIGPSGVMLSAYLFHDEYPKLQEYTNYGTWWGHFEFKGFVITGHSMTLPRGPDPKDYLGPTRIFSGHFHKRQTQGHVTYVGNPFPTNYGDVDDSERGMMIYDHNTDDVRFVDWPDCPMYHKVHLSKLLDALDSNSVDAIITANSRVTCYVDIDITYEESLALRQTFIETFKLREFNLEDSGELGSTLSETDAEIDVEDLALASVDDLVVKMIDNIQSDKIDKHILIDQYRQLRAV